MEGFRSHRLSQKAFREASIRKLNFIRRWIYKKIQIRNIKRLHWNNWEFDEDTLETGSPIRNILEFEDHIEFDRTKMEGISTACYRKRIRFFQCL